MPKFDVVCGNPPYLMGTHLKFLKLGIEMTKENGYILFVHPAQWLLVEGKKNFTNIQKYLIDIFNNNAVEIQLIKAKKYFSAAIGNVLAINKIHLNNTKSILVTDDVFTNGKYTILDILSLSKYGTSDLYKNLKAKIINTVKNENILTYLNKDVKQYIVNVPRVRGHLNESDDDEMYLNDFYTLLPKTYINPENSIDEKKDRWFSFDTKIKADNFIKFLKTNYVRFCLSIRKNNIATFQTSECNLIPWMDFSQEWSDEKLYEYFNLTPEEIKFIEENIPDYYND